MEDIMQPGMRKLEPVGDVVDDGRDAVRPVELPLGDHMQGRWGSMAKAEPDPVPNIITDVAVVLVVEALVDCLGLL